MEIKGAQLAFCDLSTPHAGGKGFFVYDDVRGKFIARGIPADEVAFIQEYDDDISKASLFKAVRGSKVRVLMGSTAKMGEGTNVQKRLAALHHLDAPWCAPHASCGSRAGNPRRIVPNPLFSPARFARVFAARMAAKYAFIRLWSARRAASRVRMAVQKVEGSKAAPHTF